MLHKVTFVSKYVLYRECCVRPRHVWYEVNAMSDLYLYTNKVNVVPDPNVIQSECYV